MYLCCQSPSTALPTPLTGQPPALEHSEVWQWHCHSLVLVCLFSWYLLCWRFPLDGTPIAPGDLKVGWDALIRAAYLQTNTTRLSTYALCIFTLPSSLIICICHTNLTVLLHRTVKVCLPAKDRFFLLTLSSNLVCQGIDYSWLLQSAGKSFRILICGAWPQRVLELTSVYSQFGKTDTGKLENPGKHLTSFFSWLRNSAWDTRGNHGYFLDMTSSFQNSLSVQAPQQTWYQPWDLILSWSIPSPAHPALEMGWLLPLQSWSRGCRCLMQKLPPHCSQTTFIISFLLQPGFVHLFVKIWVREDRKLAMLAFCEPWPSWRHRKAAQTSAAVFLPSAFAVLGCICSPYLCGLQPQYLGFLPSALG